MTYDLSILIPAKKEEFLARTIQDIVQNKRGRTQVIAVLDGLWADPPVVDHPDVVLIHLPTSIGQRAATNLAARTSTAKFLMKCDAHVSFAPGFDIALMKDCEPDWIVTPRLFNLYVYDWMCSGCGTKSYQGPRPNKCGTCAGNQFEKAVVWLPRNGEYWKCCACLEFIHDVNRKPKTCPKCGENKGFINIERRVHDSYRFDSELHFQYFHDFPVQEGLAAFIHAKRSSWIHRLLAVDIRQPDDRLLRRVREYVLSYGALPLARKHELRHSAIKMLAFIRANTNRTKKGRAHSADLLNLIDMAQGHLIESMSMLGAAWFLHRDYYWEIGGCDESHGSWGQQGTEKSCKAFLSGGKIIVNRATFFCHQFRTQSGDAFPYGIQGNDQEAAKQYSRDLWRNNKWPGQIYPLSHLVERFWPVPGWSNEDLAEQKAREVGWKPRG